MLTVIIAVGTLGGLGGGWWWRLELFCHFQIQYALGSVCALLCFALMRRRNGALAAGLILLINLYWLVPLYIPNESSGTAVETRSGTQATASLKLVYANVDTGNLDTQRLLDLVQKEAPDLVLLAEVNDRWTKALAGLDRRYPHRVVHPQIDNFGIGGWSRYRLEVGAIRFWGDANLPSFEAQFRHQGRLITILLTHPLPPMRKRLADLRNQQLRTLAGIAKSHGEGTILIGDFNTTPFTPIFSEVLTTSGLCDSTRGFGPQPSWPADLPWLLRIPIDHCLHSPDLVIVERRLGPDIGSDHLPLVLEFR